MSRKIVIKKSSLKKIPVISSKDIDEPPKPCVLAQRNAHPRDINISFEEEGHVYTVLGERGTYTSVTTWVHEQFPHFDSNAIIDNILKSPKRDDPRYKYYGKTREDIEAEWETNRVAASTAGTKMHFDIECYYNEIDVSNPSIEYAYFKKFVEDFPWLEAYRTEWTVYHEELKVSGSIDMVYRDSRDGSFYIYDWKRSKEIKYDDSFCDFALSPSLNGIPNLNFWHYSLQLGIYKAILEEKYGLKIAGMFLIVLHPDNSEYMRLETADLSKEIKELFEERKLSVMQAKV
jgi:PD-(D/E)XK nuclease superfamily